MDNPLAMYDITTSIENSKITKEEMIQKLHKIAKRWCFQIEKGKKTGFMHYQVRLSLKVKQRFSSLLKNLPFVGRWSRTSNPTYYAGNEFYVQKEETRIEGPFTDREYQQHKLTKQLKIFMKEMKETPRVLHEDIIKECQIYDPRKINFIYDTMGDSGKSILAEYLEYINVAEEIPPYRMMDDIFQWVATRPIKKAYLVDMPRAMKKKNLADFYSGIEIVKNGVAFDKRYKGTKIRFDRPRIFIFANEKPNFKFLTKDKWVIWEVEDGFTYRVTSGEDLSGGKPGTITRKVSKQKRYKLIITP